MAQLKHIKTRLTSVKNTQQITKAMKMIAAVKLRKVQHLVEASRPFSDHILDMIYPLFAEREPTDLSPYLKRQFVLDGQNPQTVRLIVVTADKGLCSSYNTNAIRTAEQELEDLLAQGHRVTIDVVGKRGADYFKKHHKARFGTFHEDIGRQFTRDLSISLMKTYRQDYLNGEFNHIICVFTEFVSTMTQKVRTKTLLPIHPGLLSKEHATPHAKTMAPFLVEPEPKTMAEELIGTFLDTRFYQVLLDSIASEHGARMMAMENATKNAKDMISKLNRKYNQQRQANITSEILDIVGGAEALT